MTVEERVLRVITSEAHRTLHPDEIDRTFEEIGIDSLDRVCILFGIEQEFDLHIPESEARNYSTVRQVINRLSQHLSMTATAGN
ncbi:MAG: hypothetical protein HY046_13545 [Acidobacteria bacterium]|nr:hypothetical protein [Acidobacteriota bacterium]